MSISPEQYSEKAPRALQIEGVGRTFGALVALDGISLTIPVGERHAILGANGAGKTTLFNVIAGDFPPTSGSVYIFGEDVTRLPAHQRIRRGLRRTFQITLLFNRLTVFENLYLAVRGIKPNRLSLRRPRPDSSDMQEATALAGRVGLENLRDRVVGEISHGQQRQLEIGMALAGHPRMLLLDEPAAGLSPFERTELRELLTAFPRSVTIALIEHDMEVALQVADRVTIMHQGRIFNQGTPEEIQADQSVHDIFMGKHGH